VIECIELTKAYGHVKAVNQLSMHVKENTITGLIGRNGAGKTTLLKLIASYYRPTSGEIRVFGEDPFNSLKVSSNLIFIDDQMSWPINLSLEDILKAESYFYPNWDMGLASRLLAYFFTNPKQNYHKLSKGMRSTFNMIIGLSSRAALTILDEPTTGMDSAVRKDFYRALLKDYLQFPRTMILSSHLLSETEDILENIVLIKNGEMVLQQPVVDLKEMVVGLQGKEEIVADFGQGRTLYHRETFGNDSVYAIVKNDLSEDDRLKAIRLGIEITAVSTDDLCIYLTDQKKGGIDDVLSGN
jgi:ABC-2 type transport system ATP-binding protein